MRVRLINPSPLRAANARRRRYWMAEAFGRHPGALHRELGYAPGSTIPQHALDRAMSRALREHDTHLERQVLAAERGRKYGPKGGRAAARRPWAARHRSAMKAARTRGKHMNPRRRRRMPAGLRKFWATHRRQGRRIVSTARRRNPGGRRRSMPAGLQRYWAKVRAALRGKRSNPHTKGVRTAMRRRRRNRMPAGLARYWARHRHRSHNPRRSYRRRRNSMFGRRRRRNRTVVYVTRGHRRSRRHNPLLSVPMGELVPLTAWAVAGMAGTRILPQMVFPQYNSGIAGYGLNFVTAVGLSWIGGKFAGSRASQGLLVGGMVGLAARILSDWLGSQTAGAWGLSGDLDFDMGFYIPNTFAVPTAGSGPFLLNAGVTGQPSMNGGVPGMAPVALPATAGGTAAAAPQGSAANPTAAQLSQMPQVAQGGAGGNTPGAWSSRWAA